MFDTEQVAKRERVSCLLVRDVPRKSHYRQVHLEVADKPRFQGTTNLHVRHADWHSRTACGRPCIENFISVDFLGWGFDQRSRGGQRLLCGFVALLFALFLAVVLFVLKDYRRNPIYFQRFNGGVSVVPQTRRESFLAFRSCRAA